MKIDPFLWLAWVQDKDIMARLPLDGLTAGDVRTCSISEGNYGVSLAYTAVIAKKK